MADNNKALSALALGSSGENTPGTWILGLYGRVQVRLYNCETAYYPDASDPSHVLLWSDYMCAAIEYHSVEYLYEEK